MSQIQFEQCRLDQCPERSARITAKSGVDAELPMAAIDPRPLATICDWRRGTTPSWRSAADHEELERSVAIDSATALGPAAVRGRPSSVAIDEERD